MKSNPFGKTLGQLFASKLFLRMRITFFLLMLSIMSSYAFVGYSQNVALSLNMKNATIEEVLNEIENRTDYHFLYSKRIVNVSSKVDISVDKEELSSVLDELFEGTNIAYIISDRQIVLNRSGELTAANQQEKVLTGIITDAYKEPIIGANIIVPGQSIGTVTDHNGQFQLAVPADAREVEIRYVGYITEQVNIRNTSVINIVLKEDLQHLEDVIVIGYGVQKKENLTGAVDAIKGEKLANRSVASTSQSLQGMSPGMTVVNAGGAPGDDGGQIKIRGVGTFNNSNPLILVDNVPVSDIDNIDPQDIDNISILKDAASSAIYGARAANGVILITTKRGGQEGISVRYSGYTGWQSLTRSPEWVSADDYMRLVNESMINANREPKYSDEAIRETMAGTNPYKYPNTDWWGLLFRNALQHKHTVSVSGGSEKLKTSVSVNYLNREGVMINTQSEQYGIRANNDIKIHEKLDAGLDLNFNVKGREEPSKIGDVYWNLLHDVPPTVAAYYPDGTYPLGPTNRNPLAAADVSGYQKIKKYQFIASPFVRYRVFQDLSLSARASIKEDFTTGKRYHNFYEFKDYDTKQTTLTWYNTLDEWSTNWHYINWQAMADYDKMFGDHYMHVLIGYSQEYQKYRDIGGYRQDFYSNELQELNQGSEEGRNNWGSGNEWALRSLFGRINYAFKDRYLLEANFRYDGSSRFAKGRRFGFFPSFSGAWRMSEEGFLKENEQISNLKLRASWGKLGNQDIDLYQYIHTMTLGQNYSFNGQLASGAAQTALANELISWETTTSFDVGLDIGFWNNKFNLTADYYIRKTDDILLKRDIPLTVGLSAPVQNVGAMKNTGWEVALSYYDKAGDFEYAITATLADVRNKIVRFGEDSAWDWYINREGESINSLYGYVSDGLFQTQEEVDNHAYQHSMTAPGDIKYKDLNNDGIINSDDKVIIGSTVPRYTYGLTLNGKYKGFDLNLFFNGVGKCNGFQYGALIEGPIWDGFTTKEMLDRWTPDNPKATWPRLVYNTIHNQEASDYWIQNTSYFRLKNIQFGYSLPKTVLQKIHIDRIRVYVSGENMFTLTNAKNLDPEFPSGRATYYPQTKVLSLGLDITF